MISSQRGALDWIEGELAALDERQLLRVPTTRFGPQGARVVSEGRELINFSSNDYLGIAGDRRLCQAVGTAAGSEGWGSGASPLLTGRARPHALLEQRLAEFERCEAALLFSSGFTANLGAIVALAGPGDVIYSDEYNHASIVDGCRLSRATVSVYPHGDFDRLAQMLGDGASNRRRLIVSDTLFSMDGDFAPLAELAELADRHRCMLLVDEAHATGVFGVSGSGLAEHLGIDERIDARVGTLSKALGCAGGFVCGKKSLIDLLMNRARSYVFSTAQPAAACAAALSALEIVESGTERRQSVLANATQLRAQLKAQGWDIGPSQSQIIPILVGETGLAMAISAALADRGILAPAIRPPSVPAGRSRLRISVCFGHTRQMLDDLVEALADLRASFTCVRPIGPTRHGAE